MKDDIRTKIEALVDTLFAEFLEEHDIEDGFVPPLTEFKLAGAVEALAETVMEGMKWQEENAPRIAYEQTYAPDTDTTFIIKSTYMFSELVQREVTGFYAGSPTIEDFEAYKSAGTLAEY